jgi:hypothetical protein
MKSHPQDHALPRTGFENLFAGDLSTVLADRHVEQVGAEAED